MSLILTLSACNLRGSLQGISGLKAVWDSGQSHSQRHHIIFVNSIWIEADVSCDTEGQDAGGRCPHRLGLCRPRPGFLLLRLLPWSQPGGLRGHAAPAPVGPAAEPQAPPHHHLHRQVFLCSVTQCQVPQERLRDTPGSLGAPVTNSKLVCPPRSFLG